MNENALGKVLLSQADVHTGIMLAYHHVASCVIFVHKVGPLSV